MQQIPIDASFLDSCLQTFLDTPFHTATNASLLPVIYETIASNSIRTDRQKEQLKISKPLSYTGFIASFYQDGQLESFAYIKKRVSVDFIKLETEEKRGVCNYSVEYSGSLVPCSEKYVNGKSIEPPFLWGDDDIIREIDFFKWVRQEIHYVINSGLYELGK